MDTTMQNNAKGYLMHLYEGLYCYLRKCIFSILSIGPVPKHIAFIMDGNRRYAKKMNLAEVEGHKAGFLGLLSILRFCYELGVKYVSIYAFSIDNFKRKPKEVHNLMEMMRQKIDELLQQESIINEYGVRIHFIGNIQLLSEPVRLAVERAMRLTAHNNQRVLLICVAYTSRDEIVHSVQESCKEKWDETEASNVASSDKIARIDSSFQANATNEIIKEGNKYKECEVTNSSIIKLVDIERNMYMAVAPEPDILIRTSGEARLSNFLLWQTSTCPLYAPNALWPEIGFKHLVLAVLNFQKYHLYLGKKKKEL